METYKIRYGESFDFTVVLSDETALTATFLVGKEGQVPEINISAPFVDGEATIEVAPEDTMIPLGEYKYQITVELEGNKVHKYPTDEQCGAGGLPEFIVLEALDETEVS